MARQHVADDADAESAGNDAEPASPQHRSGQQTWPYDAFISYSHADARNLAAATKIETDLEHLPLPKTIRRQLGRRHLNVFRDVSDLTGSRLAPSLERHLAESRTLLVLCSPAARASEYVDLEIRRFAALRDRSEIFPILIDGTLNHDPKSDPSQWALPDALADMLGGTPFVPDMRQAWTIERRREKLAQGSPWIQVASNVLGVRTDDLTARITRSERRRLTTLVSIVIAVILALSSALAVAVVMAILQHRARVDAENNAHLAISRSLVAQSRSIGDRDPDLAKQLLAVASRYGDGDLVRAALLDSVRLPDVVPVVGLPRAARISPNGAVMAVASDSGTAVVDLNSRRRIGDVPGVAGYTGALAISPDGRRVATGGRNGDIQVIHLSDDDRSIAGVETRRIVDSGGDPLNAAGIIDRVVFDATGQNLLVVNHHAEVIRVDLRRGLADAPLQLSWSPPDADSAFALSEDGRTAASLSAGRVTLLGSDGVTLVPRGSLDTPNATGISLSDSGHKLLVTVGTTATLWDVSSPSDPVRQGALVEAGFRIENAAFSPDERAAVVTNRSADSRLWDLRDPTQPVAGDALPGASTSFARGAFSPTGDRVLTFANGTRPRDDGVTADERGAVRIWPVRGSRRMGLPGERLVPGAHPRFSPDSRRLLTGTNLPRVADLDNGHQTELAQLAIAASAQTGAAFLDADEIVAVHPPAVYSLDSRSTVTSRTNLWSEFTSVIPVPHSHDVLAYSATDGARLWPRVGDDRLFVAGDVVAGGKVDCAGFSPGAAYLALCVDGRARIYGGNGGESIGTIDLPATTVAFIDDRTVAVGTRTGEIATYRISTSSVDPVWTRTRTASKVLQLSAAEAGGMLASIDQDGRLTIWSGSTSDNPFEMATVDTTGTEFAAPIALSPDGTHVALSGAAQDTTHLFDIGPDGILQRICVWTRPISIAEWHEYVPGEDFKKPCQR